jgi:adenosyl cobinamide kinase/adenosyl cobinamide phosphate guanylyltransferase
MVRNILILCGPDGAADFAAPLAAESGDDVGLVNTAIAPADQKASGGRIEAERAYGGLTVSVFDEPLAPGSAIAQLAGHADVVILDRLDDWATRMSEHDDDEASIASEITSVESVVAGQLADIVLVSRPAGTLDGAAGAWHQRMLDAFMPLCDTVIDLTAGAPQALKGSLPA